MLIQYNNAELGATSSQIVVEWQALGFRIATQGGNSIGVMGLVVQNIGNQNINGQAWLVSTATLVGIGLRPGQTSGVISTTGPLIDFVMVGPSAVAPNFAANIRCWRIASGGVERVQAWAMRSSEA
jgi:hypothetical protein